MRDTHWVRDQCGTPTGWRTDPGHPPLNLDFTQREIDFSGASKITGKGLSSLRGLSAVDDLRVQPELIDDNTLRLVTTLPGLTSLNCDPSSYESRWQCIDLTKTKTTKAGLEALAHSEGSTFLVPWELLDDRTLGWITEAPNFGSLNCWAEDCSYASGGAMPCPRKGCVAIVDTAVTVEGARALAEHRNIKMSVADEALASKLRVSVPRTVEITDREQYYTFMGLP